MIKRTLIAIAAIALLTSVTFGVTSTGWPESDPKLFIWNHTAGDSAATKVDGKMTVRWPFEYKFLEICRIPVYMKIGMYIKVIDCDKYKVILEQVDCADLKKAHPGDDIKAEHYPCYEGCAKHKDGWQGVKVISNFPAELGATFYKLVDGEGNAKDGGKVIDKANANVTPSDIPASTETKVDVCVWTWKTKLEMYGAGDEVKVGEVAVTARPKV